jgi:hypothetical protein
MSNNFRHIIQAFIISVFVTIISMATANSVEAAQIKLTLKDIGANQNVDLKTVKTFRNFYFTKPEHWKMLPTSKVNVIFQHSPQLLPERSSLNILINDQSIKTIELNPGNAQKTNISFAIPVDILKDFNKITFDVDQHYTYKCEDPFDPALWTTVLNDSVIQLDYQETVPATDFARFPYPLYDDLAYETTQLNFVLPKAQGNSDGTIKGMAMVDAAIAQHIGWKDVKVNAYTQDNLNEHNNLIIVGTPEENPAIQRFNNSLPYKVQNGQLVDSQGNTVSETFGILMIVPNPKATGKVILIVSGNSPEGVEKAANALTQKPTSGILKGNVVVVKETLKNDLADFRDWPGYITKKSARFIELGLDSKTVRGVTSVPAEYSIKIMPDITMPPRNFVTMHLDYSYAANLDPTMSKLEVIINDISQHSVVLDNTNGENHKTLEIEIPTEDVKMYNEVKFRFHLFPIKYDLCRFTTDEHIWGTIHNTTSMSFPAEIKTVIPDVGLINDGGYPFTAYRDMQEDVFVLANEYNAIDAYALLWIVARLGKMTNPTEAINFDVVRYSNMTSKHKNDKNIIAIGTANRNKLITNSDAEMDLIFSEDQFKIMKKEKMEKVSEIKELHNMGIIEQMLSPWNSNRVMMIVFGQDDKGLLNAVSLFSDNEKFKNLKRGNIVAVSGNTVKSVTTLNKDQARIIHGEQVKRKAATADFWWNLFKIFLMIIGALALIKIIFGAFIRGASGQG